jgi:hypothetical protein
VLVDATDRRRFANCTRPARLFLISTPRPSSSAVPPMWNVRIVSCVPGSPIDCARDDADGQAGSATALRDRSMP